MKRLDDLAVKKYKVKILQMMELAGYHLAQLSCEKYPKAKSVFVVSGTGNNGGGGLAAARHLANSGKEVTIFVKGKHNIKISTNRQIETLTAMGIDFVDNLSGLKNYDVILDALDGYGLKGNLRHGILKDINKINASDRPVVSLDAPSGLNVDTGDPSPVAILAKHTLVLAAIKTGLEDRTAGPFTGELHLADIGIPKKAYRELRIPYPF